jgi:hypothetical protein
VCSKIVPDTLNGGPAGVGAAPGADGAAGDGPLPPHADAKKMIRTIELPLSVITYPRYEAGPPISITVIIELALPASRV